MISPVMPTYARASLAFVKGEGSWLINEDGRRFLDFGAGIAVNSLGHAHPRLVGALCSQAADLWHTSNLYRIPAQEKLADLLVQTTFADTVFFTNSGTEATEAAVKMARRCWHERGQPERSEILTLKESFHGRTISMISATGAKKLTDGFGPLTPGFRQVMPNDIDDVEAAISENTAAIMVEPVMGEGGIVPLTDGFLRALRDLCDRSGALLIFDEIQCGMGRTGRLFAHEWAGITPDIMAVAKGIGGGFPLGACLATADAAAGMTAGTHGSTYGGNPLACAVGFEVLKIISDEGFLEQVRARSGLLRQRLESIADSYPDVFSEVRGSGLMLGLVCKIKNLDVIEAGYDESILTIPAGGNVVRLLPPLNVSEVELDEACSRIDRAAAKLSEGLNA